MVLAAAAAIAAGATPEFRQPLILVSPLPPFATRRRARRLLPVASAGGGSGGRRVSWEEIAESLRRGGDRFRSGFSGYLRDETGLDLESAARRTSELLVRVGEAARDVKTAAERAAAEFVDWNRWEKWKDIEKWDPKRLGALILYSVAVMLSFYKSYAAFTYYIDRQHKQELMEEFMEALIPEPSPANVRIFKKGMWRKTMPKGLKMKKFIQGPGSSQIQDTDYVGEDAWDDDLKGAQETPIANLEDRTDLNYVQKKEPLGSSDNSGSYKNYFLESERHGDWRNRFRKWKEILRKEKQAELIDSISAKYVVDFDMNEVEKSLRKDVVEKFSNTQENRALWIGKRWWLYRPKLPYTYFLDKLNSSEVDAVVISEDLKKVYVTMKEGFPMEYVVDIPLDPYLFEAIAGSCVEVDLLQRTQLHYFLKVVIALAPGLLILYLIRESLMLMHITSQQLLYKLESQLFDMAYAENFILPVENMDDTIPMYKDVVLGGDVWDLLDEIMVYMNNPMQYFEKKVAFVRGILLSGPPGTGKTLFARTLSKESGMPFVFASGAEFTDSERSGAARINQIFSTARRNAPSFVFIDEIDAIAGRHAKKDPQRRATYDALITQLDGEKVKTGVDRFSLRQAVIFICATNRPDELDSEFVRPGRIDRRLYIGLPDAKQRIDIFGVHSSGKNIAEDVNFGELVFRTVGYSGADIRNLVNEAAIMSVRKGNLMISQQDIIDVLDKQLLEGMGVLLTEEEQQKCEASISLETRKLLAVHEAGHILLAHIFPRFDWHAFSQLLPGGKETSISVFYPREDMVDQGYTTFGYMKMQMVVAHGGRCAERIVFGENITDLGRDDLEKITKIAREMVISPRNSKLGLAGIVRRVGLVDRPDSPDGELIKYKWDDPHVFPADMTVEVSELFTRELTRYIDETEEMAMKGILQNRHILDTISKVLLEKSRITGLEVEEMLKGLVPVMLQDLAKPFQIKLDEEGPLHVNRHVRYQPQDVYAAPLHRC